MSDNSTSSAKDIVQKKKRTIRTLDIEDQIAKKEERDRKELQEEVSLFIENLGENTNDLTACCQKSDETIGKVQAFMDYLKLPENKESEKYYFEYLRIHSHLDQSLVAMYNVVSYDTQDAGLFWNALKQTYAEGAPNYKACWDLLWKRMKWHREVVKQSADILKRSGTPVKLTNTRVNKETTSSFVSAQEYL